MFFSSLTRVVLRTASLSRHYREGRNHRVGHASHRTVRDAKRRFWFTHALNANASTNCATLLAALQANVGASASGFYACQRFLMTVTTLRMSTML